MTSVRDGARQRGVEIADRLAARRLDLGSRLVGIVNQNVHFHGQAALGGAGADAAESDNEQRLAEEIVGQFAEAVAPIAVFDDGMHFRSALGQRQHHEHGLLRDRRRIGGARHHQRNLAAGKRRHIDGVEADADPGHHLHVPGGLELRFAEPGGAQRHAMHRRLRLEHGFEIACGNHIGEFDEFDVVPLPQQRPSWLRHRFSDENFLLVGRHSLSQPPGFSCLRPSKDDAGTLI